MINAAFPIAMNLIFAAVIVGIPILALAHNVGRMADALAEREGKAK